MADLLVDEGIGQDLVHQLSGQGFTIFHTLEFHSKGTRDSLVFLEAQRRSLTVFTGTAMTMCFLPRHGEIGESVIIMA